MMSLLIVFLIILQNCSAAPPRKELSQVKEPDIDKMAEKVLADLRKKEDELLNEEAMHPKPAKKSKENQKTTAADPSDKGTKFKNKGPLLNVLKKKWLKEKPEKDQKNSEQKIENELDDILKADVDQGKRTKRSLTFLVNHNPDDIDDEYDKNTIKSYANNPDTLLEYFGSMYGYKSARKGKLRDGVATDTHSCNKIRGVPPELRDPNHFLDPVDPFYQKYTEAFGIPILGSKDVTDAGLKRACYQVRYMFGCRYDLRNFYYGFYGRYALIADNEEQNYLPEYKYMSAAYNNRVRGVGPTMEKPVTSAGDDNQRCTPFDRYYDQDILGHEAGHALHQMASSFSIPGFAFQLQKCYNDAITKGKYPGTYAATNKNEYWAVAVQMYMNSYHGGDYIYPGLGPNGEDLKVRNRESLKMYDPCIVKLLDEVFPCGNRYVHRCTWKDCSLSNFELIWQSGSDGEGKSNCRVLSQSYGEMENASMCADYTCYYLGNAFNFKSGADARCQALDCGKVDKTKDGIAYVYEYLEMVNVKKGFDVYMIKRIPEMNLEAELTIPMEQNCATRLLSAKVDSKNTENVRCIYDPQSSKPCGPTPMKDSSKACKRRGCCHDDDHGCFFPEQSTSDKNPYCPIWAEKKVNGVGECDRNPAMMLLVCPTSCNAAKYAYIVKKAEAIAKKLCQDKIADIIDVSKCRDANGNPNPTLQYYHELECGFCKLDKKWRHQLGIPNYP